MTLDKRLNRYLPVLTLTIFIYLMVVILNSGLTSFDKAGQLQLFQVKSDVCQQNS